MTQRAHDDPVGLLLPTIQPIPVTHLSTSRVVNGRPDPRPLSPVLVLARTDHGPHSKHLLCVVFEGPALQDFAGQDREARDLGAIIVPTEIVECCSSL
jgi:hypothetical protein